MSLFLDLNYVGIRWVCSIAAENEILSKRKRFSDKYLVVADRIMPNTFDVPSYDVKRYDISQTTHSSHDVIEISFLVENCTLHSSHSLMSFGMSSMYWEM